MTKTGEQLEFQFEPIYRDNKYNITVYDNGRDMSEEFHVIMFDPNTGRGIGYFFGGPMVIFSGVRR